MRNPVRLAHLFAAVTMGGHDLDRSAERVSESYVNRSPPVFQQMGAIPMQPGAIR